eukprot:784042-Pyramimonas_sp.AAC.1
MMWWRCFGAVGGAVAAGAGVVLLWCVVVLLVCCWCWCGCVGVVLVCCGLFLAKLVVLYALLVTSGAIL